MEITLFLKSERPSVFLLNGKFVEQAEKVFYRHNEPLYVTVLPLDALFLPYTVKLVAGKPLTNETLARAYVLENNAHLILLKCRHSFVYSANYSKAPDFDEGIIPKFFKLVKQRLFSEARDCLTIELGADLTNEALFGFFEEYSLITQNNYTPQKGWLLLRDSGTCDICQIAMRSGLIDNFVL